jgi:hypothetical protein
VRAAKRVFGLSDFLPGCRQVRRWRQESLAGTDFERLPIHPEPMGWGADDEKARAFPFGDDAVVTNFPMDNAGNHNF